MGVIWGDFERLINCISMERHISIVLFFVVLISHFGRFTPKFSISKQICYFSMQEKPVNWLVLDQIEFFFTPYYVRMGKEIIPNTSNLYHNQLKRKIWH